MEPESFANVPTDLVVTLNNVDKAGDCQCQKHGAGNAGQYQFDQNVSSFHVSLVIAERRLFGSYPELVGQQPESELALALGRNSTPPP